jgi:hypothetical protein
LLNPFNYADGLLRELEFATKKADKDAVKSELAWAAEEIKKFDASGLEESERHFVSDVATRLAAALEAK